jgi:flavin-dependent dehydrogenase
MTAHRTSFDFCIVGAGVAGLAAAHKLRSAGARVAILSSVEAGNGFKHGDYLPHSAARLLRDLNLESLLLENGIPDFSGIQSCWGIDELISTDFVPNTNERGWLIDRWSFDRSFQAEVQNKGAAFFYGKLKRAKRRNGSWQVDGGEIEIEADWVIDASGRSAHFATAQGAIRHDDDPQFSVVRWFQAEARDNCSSPIVEAVQNGWWYTALLPKSIRVVTFQGEASVVAPMCRSLGDWTSCLKESRHVGPRIWFARELTRPRFLQANGSYVAPAAGINWLAVGDAALSFDPISSQGIFSALYTGLRAAEAVMSGTGVEEYLNRLASVREAYQKNVARIYGELDFTSRFQGCALLSYKPQ